MIARLLKCAHPFDLVNTKLGPDSSDVDRNDGDRPSPFVSIPETGQAEDDETRLMVIDHSDSENREEGGHQGEPIESLVMTFC